MPESGLIVSDVEDVCVVEFQEQTLLNTSTVERLSGQLNALVDNQGVNKLVLDFATVRFLSSQMLGALLALHKKLKEVGGELVLCGMGSEVGRVFRIMNLHKTLRMHRDTAAALKHFGVRSDAPEHTRPQA
ncbi:MAG: STAS domain-containing protein [Phycisphaerae bacterium]